MHTHAHKHAQVSTHPRVLDDYQLLCRSSIGSEHLGGV